MKLVSDNQWKLLYDRFIFCHIHSLFPLSIQLSKQQQRFILSTQKQKVSRLTRIQFRAASIITVISRKILDDEGGIIFDVQYLQLLYDDHHQVPWLVWV